MYFIDEEEEEEEAEEVQTQELFKARTPQRTLTDPFDNVDPTSLDPETVKAKFAEIQREKVKAKEARKQDGKNRAEERQQREADMDTRTAQRNMDKGKGKAKDPSGYRY